MPIPAASHPFLASCFSRASRVFHARRGRAVVTTVLGALAGLSVWLVAPPAHADRYVVVYDEPYQPRSAFNLGFDLEGVAPLLTPRFPSGNNLSGGGGFKVRFGDQIRFRHVRVTPEGGYAFDHLFATDDTGTAYDWDMHRLFGGVRVEFGRIVTPGFYVHLGYGWRDTGDPSIPPSANGGLAFDAAFILDVHITPLFALGGHIEYVTIDAQPYVPEWLAFGLHADITF
jgi:hypothetical protein